MVKEYLLRQPSKTSLDAMREPDGQWRCSSMHAMVIVIHHHNIGLHRAESITSLSFHKDMIYILYPGCERDGSNI